MWVLDEVDAALDEANQRLVATLLSQLGSQRGGIAQISCVSHNSAFQELCTSVIEVTNPFLGLCQGLQHCCDQTIKSQHRQQ